MKKKKQARAERRRGERLTETLILNKRNGFVQMTKGEELEINGILNLDKKNDK